jgi:hypothetical protein
MMHGMLPAPVKVRRERQESGNKPNDVTAEPRFEERAMPAVVKNNNHLHEQPARKDCQGQREPSQNRQAEDSAQLSLREKGDPAVDLPPPLSSDLIALRSSSAGRSMTIDELQTALKGRGVAMLLLLLALPFCLISVPGLSTPFGLAVLLIGIRIAFQQKPWLPRFVRQRSISAPRLVKVLAGGIRFAKLMEKVVKPRMHFLHSWPGAMNLIGLGIAAGGTLLLLPLPIPFSNIVPAWAVVLLTAGMMERDGLMVLLGHAMTLVSWAVIFFAWLYGAEGIQKLLEMLF